MTAIEHAYAVAQELTPDERVQLANMLLDEAESAPVGWSEEFERELDEISDAIESGRMKTVPWEDVRRRMYERIARHAD